MGWGGDGRGWEGMGGDGRGWDGVGWDGVGWGRDEPLNSLGKQPFWPPMPCAWSAWAMTADVCCIAFRKAPLTQRTWLGLGGVGWDGFVAVVVSFMHRNLANPWVITGEWSNLVFLFHLLLYVGFLIAKWLICYGTYIDRLCDIWFSH